MRRHRSNRKWVLENGDVWLLWQKGELHGLLLRQNPLTKQTERPSQKLRCRSNDGNAPFDVSSPYASQPGL
jgi:hypothetical protein